MRRYFTYGAIFAIVLILGALASWYFLIREQRERIAESDSARGSAEAPFAGIIGSTYANIVGALGGSESGGKTTVARLWRVSNTPVAGMAYASGTTLSFVERATGYVLSADPGTGEVRRVTNTLKPRVYDALLANGTFILRSLEGSTPTTFVGTVATSSAAGSVASEERSLAGAYLQKNIVEIAAHPAGQRVFSLLLEENGETTGVASNTDGSKAARIFNSPVGGWNVSWLPDGRIILAQKAADGIVGFAYALAESGELSPIASGPGLTVLPKSSSEALLLGESGGDVSLFAHVSKNATPVRLPIHTAADKCVWSPGKTLVAFCAVPQSTPLGSYLGERYAGILHTSDAWWRVDASAGTAELLYAPEESGISVDVERPTIDATGSYIAFRNAADQSLWVLRTSAQ
jgi:hypothetical protein